MGFKKKVPHQKAEGSYTTWVEVELSEQEETAAQDAARDEHISLYKQCLDDAKEIALSMSMKAFDPNVIQIANALFEKRASHVVYYKEDKIQEKFQERFSQTHK